MVLRRNEREIITEIIDNIIDYAYVEYKSTISLDGWDKKGAIICLKSDDDDHFFYHIGYFGKPRGNHLLKVRAMINNKDEDPKADEIVISASSSAVFSVIYN